MLQERQLVQVLVEQQRVVAYSFCGLFLVVVQVLVAEQQRPVLHLNATQMLRNPILFR
jgi:hypothetical protein